MCLILYLFNMYLPGTFGVMGFEEHSEQNSGGRVPDFLEIIVHCLVICQKMTQTEEKLENFA